MSRLPVFRGRDFYAPHSACGYRLLPFRFMRWSADDEVLLTNDVGEFLFVNRVDFDDLIQHRMSRSAPAYSRLEAKHFLLDSTSDTPIELLATKYRTKKSFLTGFTGLHLFVLTLRCDHTCTYCQVSRVSMDRSRFDMSRETAKRAVSLMFKSPARQLKVEFQGGEPLLNFDLLRQVVEDVEQCNEAEGRDVQFVVTTNMVPLTDTILDYLKEHRILISTSLDGPAQLHNANRPRPGRDSHEIMVRNLEKARAVLGHDQVSAVMTTSRRSLDHPIEIVDEYVKLGFDSIFLRPISPYGFAARRGQSPPYESPRFLSFYKRALEHIIKLNREGHDVVEVYAQILLTRMLTPFTTGYVDLQSPAGAGLGAVAYNYDGDVYASDEARMLAAMGDKSFRLGNVHVDSYEEIFGGETMRHLAAGSVLESLPGCSDCAFLPYCGSDAIFNYRTQGDVVGHRPTSAFCMKNMEIIRYLFERWRGGDELVRELFMRWATGVDPRDTQEAAS